MGVVKIYREVKLRIYEHPMMQDSLFQILEYFVHLLIFSYFTFLLCNSFNFRVIHLLMCATHRFKEGEPKGDLTNPCRILAVGIPKPFCEQVIR